MKMLSPRRRLVSFSFSSASCCLVWEMNASASATDTEAEKGPFNSKSSAVAETVFLNSSAECIRVVLNFSYRVIEHTATPQYTQKIHVHVTIMSVLLPPPPHSSLPQSPSLLLLLPPSLTPPSLFPLSSYFVQLPYHLEPCTHIYIFTATLRYGHLLRSQYPETFLCSCNKSLVMHLQCGVFTLFFLSMASLSIRHCWKAIHIPCNPSSCISTSSGTWEQEGERNWREGLEGGREEGRRVGGWVGGRDG